MMFSSTAETGRGGLVGIFACLPGASGIGKYGPGDVAPVRAPPTAVPY